MGRTTTVLFAVILRVLPAASKPRQLSSHGLAVRFLLIPLPLLVLLHARPVFAVDPPVCPAFSKYSASDTLNVPRYRGYRPLVAGDYVVIEYNAAQNKTSWTDYKRVFDYHKLNNHAYPIDWNGSFLPVIDTKEKIAVRVCGLHFTDVLTVTTGPTGVPEGGADIRGAGPVTPVTSLSSTLDTLQSGVPTGGTTTLPGLGLNAPAVLPSLAIAGITPGSLGTEDQTPGKLPTYTPATVTSSGKQVALLLYSVERNAMEVSRLIDRTLGQPYEAAYTEEETNEKSAPGSVKGVEFIVRKILGQVRTDWTDPTNFAVFDRHLTDIQNINAQISTLSSALSSQAFASNAITLLNNYSALTGILDLGKLGSRKTGNNCQSGLSSLQPQDVRGLDADDLGKLKFSDFANWTASQVVSLRSDQIKALSDKPDISDSNKRSVQMRVDSLQKALQGLGVAAAGTPNDQPLCSVFEQEKFADFWNSYNYSLNAVGIMVNSAEGASPECSGVGSDDFNHLYTAIAHGQQVHMDTKCFEGFVGETLKVLQFKLDDLRAELGKIDTDTTELYDKMNGWYFKSSVEQTDLLPPLTQSALVRISIAVQRGYTPFTLANPGGTITPAVTNNAVSTAVTAASTSTPAHAVKTMLVEVHRVANFNLMGGVMFIHIPTASYAAQSSPTPAVADKASLTGYIGTCAGQKSPVPAPATGTAPPTYSCIVQTQQTEWQLAGMAGLAWFPWGHDYFPRHSGYANYGRNLLPSLLLATSVTSLGNSVGGINWEPVSGLDFYAGVGSAHRTVLPSDLSVNTALPSGATFTTVTQEHAGLTIGLGFDLSVIATLFGSKSTSVASMP
jgi:hypothetical protein